MFDREAIDFAGNEKLEEVTVERRKVAFALASARFVLDPFIPATVGNRNVSMESNEL